VSLACGVFVGRKPDAFSDRASRCGASSPSSSRKRSPSRAAICCGESARTRAAASSNASGMPSSARQDPQNRAHGRQRHAVQRQSEAKYPGWSR
jgi:hypothetical protein